MSLRFEWLKVDEFIKNHTMINYCEALINKEGLITYAVPSHQLALLKHFMDLNNIFNVEEAWNIVPEEESPNNWLGLKNGDISVYTEFYIKYGEITEPQKETIKKLYEAKLIKTDKDIEEIRKFNLII